MNASRRRRAARPYPSIPWAFAAVCLACLAGTAAARDLPAGGVSFPSPEGWAIRQSGQAWLMSPPDDDNFVATLPGGIQAHGYTLAEVTDKTWEHVATTGGFRQISREQAVEGATGTGWPILFVAGQCLNAQGEAVLKAVVVIGAPTRFYPVYVDARDLAALEKHLPAVILMVRNVKPTGDPAVPLAAPGAARGIVGKWSTLSWYGNYVDPSSGAFQSDASSGEWWEFRADGTWEYIMIAYGSFISGGIIHSGAWRLEGNQLVLAVRREVWRPFKGSRPPYDRAANREERYEVQFRDEPMLRVRELPNGEWSDWMNPR
jgi:hypothetical protein